MSDSFWNEISGVLGAAKEARTADELIAAVGTGPHQDSGSGDAFFAGSGGDNQLIEALDRAHWKMHRVEGDYHWQALSKVDGTVVEYIEGDLYRREQLESGD